MYARAFTVLLLATVFIVASAKEAVMDDITHMCFCGAFPNEGCATNNMCNGDMHDCVKKCCLMCDDDPTSPWCNEGCKKEHMDNNDVRILCTGTDAEKRACEKINNGEKLVASLLS